MTRIPHFVMEKIGEEDKSASLSRAENREKAGGPGAWQKGHGLETKMDLKEGKIRPGLGPQHFGLLDLSKEDIGLASPVVLMDYPSPEMGPEYDEGVKLTKEEIVLCKKACLSITGSKKERKSLQQEENYFVELPSDDEQETHQSGSILKVEEENMLAVSMQKTLSLKRTRQLFLTGNDEWEEANANKEKRRRGNQLDDRNRENREMEDILMEVKAEEAGLNMPHLSP